MGRWPDPSSTRSSLATEDAVATFEIKGSPEAGLARGRSGRSIAVADVLEMLHSTASIATMTGGGVRWSGLIYRDA